MKYDCISSIAFNNIRKCTMCDLHSLRRAVVIGRGSIPCQLLIIGEAPGVKEDLRRYSFVGSAGILLDKIMNKACTLDKKLTRKPTFFMTNTILCHPCNNKFGKNREPSRKEILACYRNVMFIVRKCNPKQIILMGKIAQKYYKNEYPDAIHMIHPSFILRSGKEQSPYFFPVIRQMNEIYRSINNE